INPIRWSPDGRICEDITMMRLLCAGLLVMTSALTPARANDSPSGDLANLQGTWKAMGGPNRDVPLTMTVKGNDLSIEFTSGQEKRELKGRLKVDEQASPKSMDWTGMKVGDRDVPDNLAIYKIDGDTLTVRGSGPDRARPTEFAKPDEEPVRARSLV